MKPKLVKSTLPQIASVEDASRWTHAIVRRASRGSLLVEFLKGCNGILPAAYLLVQRGSNIVKQYGFGYVIQAR
jgi:hypothetical protein